MVHMGRKERGMRAIDGDALLGKVEKIQPWEPYLGKYAQGIRHCMEIVSLLIKDAPTIDPPTQPDISEYSDKLWRNAYERGKRDAQPEQRWIPVSEMEPRLPCIASDAHGNPPFIPNGILCLTTEKHDEYYMDAQYLKDGAGLLFENRIVAWMPLPEPYAERQIL